MNISALSKEKEKEKQQLAIDLIGHYLKISEEPDPRNRKELDIEETN